MSLYYFLRLNVAVKAFYLFVGLISLGVICYKTDLSLYI